MVRAADGTTIMIDDRGILQTWQDSFAENCDSGHPFVMDIFLPATTRVIQVAKLRFRLQKFRAYETGAADGGYYGSTTESKQVLINTGYEIQQGGTEAEQTTYDAEFDPYYTGYTQSAGSHNHGGSTSSVSTHNHGIPSGTELAKAGGGSVTFIESNFHSHSISSDGSHSHNIMVNGIQHFHRLVRHFHQAWTGEHNHNFSVPDHTHPLNFGIYEGTTPANVTVKINGVDRTAALGGPFNTSQTNLDITPYLAVNQWNTIELGTSQLGRIQATVFVQALMSILET